MKYHKEIQCLSARFKSFLSLASEDIELCQTWEEESKSFEVFQQVYLTKNIFKSCYSSCSQYQYTGQKIFTKGVNEKANEVFIGYTFPSNEVQVFEEYLMFGINDLIGTIGGHSGLFIGFSFFGFISTILGYFQRHLQ